MTFMDIVSIVIGVPVGLFWIGGTLVGVPLFIYMIHRDEGHHPIQAVFWGTAIGVLNFFCCMGAWGWLALYQNVTGKDVS